MWVGFNTLCCTSYIGLLSCITIILHSSSSSTSKWHSSWDLFVIDKALSSLAYDLLTHPTRVLELCFLGNNPLTRLPNQFDINNIDIIFAKTILTTTQMLPSWWPIDQPILLPLITNFTWGHCGGNCDQTVLHVMNHWWFWWGLCGWWQLILALCWFGWFR